MTHLQPSMPRLWCMGVRCIITDLHDMSITRWYSKPKTGSRCTKGSITLCRIIR